VVEYLKKVLEDEASLQNFAQDQSGLNIVARLKGNGTKKPLLIFGPQ